MNKVILLGRLTRDPEVRYTQTSNKTVATFTLALNKKTKDGEQKADFFNIVAWNKTGEFVGKYFKKGMQVGVIGKLSTREYEDNAGKTRYVTEVIAEEVHFTDKGQKQIESNESFEDDLPF